MTEYHAIEARLSAFADEMAAVVRERLTEEPERMQVLADAVSEMERIIASANHPDDVGHAREAIKHIASIWLTEDEIDERYLALEARPARCVRSFTKAESPPFGERILLVSEGGWKFTWTGKRWHEGWGPAHLCLHEAWPPDVDGKFLEVIDRG